MVVGRVLGVWGLRGDLKVELLAPLSVLQQGAKVLAGGILRSVERVRAQHRFLRLKLRDIEDRDAAAALQGQYLQIEESSLPALGEGEYYTYQLIGLHVIGRGGREIGEVRQVLSLASNDVFVLRGPLGEVLVPYTNDVVQAIDLASGTITIEELPGLLP